MRRLTTMVVASSVLWACSEPATNSEPTEQPDETMNNVVENNGVENNVGNNVVENNDMMEPEPPAYTVPELHGVETLEDINEDPDIVEVNITAAPVTHDLGDGTMVEMWAYNGQIPGPAINAKVGDEVIVHFKNDLPEDTTIHWHGLRISDEMDGNPRIQDPVEPGETFEYRFVVEEAATYWYHPHVRTHEQLEKGLYGVFVVHEEKEDIYDAERVFVLDDILLDENGLAPFYQNHPVQMHGRTGNVLLTNGSSEELKFDTTQGRVERWRFINSSNARTMKFGVDNAWARVIGVDGGLIGEPYQAGQLELPVGSRFDLEVHVSELELGVTNYVITRDDSGAIVTAPIKLASFNVEETGKNTRRIELPGPRPLPTDRAVDREENIVLAAHNDGDGVVWTINGKHHAMHEPLFEFKKGEVVRFTITNELGPEHPFHLHGQFFQIEREGDLPRPGLYDTVLVPGFSTRTIVAYMDNPGQWMTHCHIGMHAELGMMGEMLVTQ
jgi:FtsP/CotA-like multicopper oxidase with cupredoxin domain